MISAKSEKFEEISICIKRKTALVSEITLARIDTTRNC